jgi:hypothetical protein
MIFLHTVLYMIIPQTTFLHLYHLKDDIRFRLYDSPNSHAYACVSRDGPVFVFSLHVHECQSSALWVVGSGFSVTLVFLHVHELQRSVLRFTG